jgi:hypothetical protein
LLRENVGTFAKVEKNWGTVWGTSVSEQELQRPKTSIPKIRDGPEIWLITGRQHATIRAGSEVKANLVREDRTGMFSPWFRIIHTPLRSFSSEFSRTKDEYSDRLLALQSNPKFDAMTDEIPAEPNVLAYEVGGKQLISRRAYSYVWAHITSAASQDERQKVYAFNLKRLTKWGGCKDSNELLPILRHPGETEHGAPPPSSE